MFTPLGYVVWSLQQVFSTAVLSVREIRLPMSPSGYVQTVSPANRAATHTNIRPLQSNLDSDKVEPVDLFQKCSSTDQCRSRNPNSYCNSERSCVCRIAYYYNGVSCALRRNGGQIKSQEVYKADVVAVACFFVAVVGILLTCVAKKSFCRRHTICDPAASPEEHRNSGGEAFTVSEEIAALRAVEKPPSYAEVLRSERNFYGTPPPDYCNSGVMPSSTPIMQPVEIASPPTSTQTNTRWFEHTVADFHVILARAQCPANSSREDSPAQCSPLEENHNETANCRTQTSDTLPDSARDSNSRPLQASYNNESFVEDGSC